MITLNEFLYMIKYKISEGCEYPPYGPNGYIIGHYSPEYNGIGIELVFNTETNEVYRGSLHDWREHKTYNLVNPTYVTQFSKLDEFPDDMQLINIDSEEFKLRLSSMCDL